MAEIIESHTSQYTDEQRRAAVIEIYTHGSTRLASQNLGIPQRTLNDWTRKEWWEPVAAEIRHEINEKILASNLAIAQKAQEAILERIEHGDTKVLGNGERVSQPVSARDLSVIGGIAQDKARVQQNMPTSVSSNNAQQDMLKNLAEYMRLIAREEVKTVSDQ